MNAESVHRNLVVLGAWDNKASRGSPLDPKFIRGE